MKIKIFSAQERIFEGQAKEAILPAEGGEISVLDFHEPCLCRLRPGVIRLRPYDEAKEKGPLRFPVLSGIAKILSQEITVLLEV